jgi:hypothetical protein
VGWAAVTLNGADYGLSLLVETVDTRFLSRWYADPSGALYEGSHGVDLRPGHEARFEYDAGPDPDDRADLTAAIAALTAPPDDAGVAGVEARVNLEEVLTYLAAEALTAHWDGYRNTNNYRIYHDPSSDRLELLPWGTDNTFDRRGLDPWAGEGILLTYCLANAACAARYDARLVEVADALARPVDDAVLDPQRRELQAAHRRTDRGGVDAQRGERIVPALPLGLVGEPVEIVLTAVRAVCHLLQHPARDPRMQVRHQCHMGVALEAHAPGRRLAHRGAQPAQLVGEHRLESTRAGREEDGRR